MERQRRAAFSNGQLAIALGGVCERAHAGHLRAGRRAPSVEIMIRVEEVYGWSAGQQVHAVHRHVWPQAFERVLAAKYGWSESGG